MEEFLIRCREEYSVGLVQNEKEWLRSFYYDAEKCIRQNESDAEFSETCFAVLHQIKEKRSGDDGMESSVWLPLNQQVVPLNTLFKQARMCLEVLLFAVHHKKRAC
ncbi:hypothetical protein OS493_016551 [Desmophyllum pertusum]|uniref:Uncharacterized protein n=1 Tax=Desmophyllum pertusum TaxID=174260 RepID=A0A9X0D337_9CNID|nr:hypothetical protein OS493_016551 [Desmophyllum pertusum]